MTIKKAIIPAAGLGTRFLPATKAQPKEMLPIVDKPTLQYIIEEAVESGIDEILIITGRNKQAIENHFDKSIELELVLKERGDIERLETVQKISNMAQIHYVRQKEPKGLGHAIGCARTFIGNEPFAVLLGDDIVFNPDRPCLKQMIDMYDKYKSTIIGVQEVEDENISKYGIVSGEEINNRVHKLNGLVEKPLLENAPSNIAILGRYIITPAIFDIIDTTKPGKGNEIQLTDALRTLLKHEDMYSYKFKGKRYDVGSKIGFIEATIDFALRDVSIQEELKNYIKKKLDIAW